MLLVRRNAPDGSYFHDGDRAAGVFGVLATGFAVLLGFVVFLAFTSYDAARAGAETEALIVAQQVETAQFFPPPAADELTGELVCYARSVAGVQWERMEAGTLGEDAQPVGGRDVPHAADRRAADRHRAVGLRQVARPDVGPRAGPQRPHPRRGRRDPDAAVDRAVLHAPALIFVFMLFFADSGERAVVQALLMGTRGRGDHGDAAAARRSSTTRSTTASAASGRWPWNGR